jgi:Tn3 transposase DDE domain
MMVFGAIGKNPESAWKETVTAVAYPGFPSNCYSNPEIIEQQYDQLIKFATALRLGTADAESILRRFTKSNVQHPTYRALCELGKALKTVFLCDYLQLESLRREIQEGLNVVENWNSANDFYSVRQGWRVRQQPAGGSGNSDARLALTTSESRVREHADDSAGAGGAGVAGPPYCGRSPGAIATEMAAR